MNDSLDGEMLGKAKVIYHSFDYSNTVDFATLEEIHVPSTAIQSTAVLKNVISWMIENNQLDEVSPKMYRRVG